MRMVLISVFLSVLTTLFVNRNFKFFAGWGGGCLISLTCDLQLLREFFMCAQEQQGSRTSMFGRQASMIYTPAPLPKYLYKVFTLSLPCLMQIYARG